MKLLKNIKQLVQIENQGQLFKRGREMNNIAVLENVAVLYDDKIQAIGKLEDIESKIVELNINVIEVTDCQGKCVLPGFVDSHTHIVFGGDRADEFALRLAGATYKEIAQKGGGILSTVTATRNSSIEELYLRGKLLLDKAIKHGTTSIEIKSGYGLDTTSELNQLRAIKMLQNEYNMNIKSTFMGAHDFPPEFKNERDKYIDLIINEMMPQVVEENLAEYCDAFVDVGYYTAKQCEKLFKAALKSGLKLRCHCDELGDVSAAGFAVDMGCVSADHLLFINDTNIEKMANSNTVAGLLPGTAYYIRLPYSPARKLIDSGVIVALASDCNPGSCMTINMQQIAHLAVINMKMSAEEALTAMTLNSAYSLGISDKVGSIEVGKEANLLITDSSSYTHFFYEFGINHIEKTMIRGQWIG